MAKEKILGILLLIIGLILNFSPIEFKGSGFVAGAICAIGIGLVLFEFPFFNKEKNHDSQN
jgi:membrane-bound ClpP family serine protease